MARLAYFDCASGISGDMTLGALVDAGAELAAIDEGVRSLGLAGVRIVAAEVKKHGFRATQIRVEHEPEHKHRHLHHIVGLIDAGALSPRARELARRIFTRLAEAEAKVHGTTIEKVHFHEVGAVDSIADIVGTAIAWDLLEIERAVASPVPTGQGFVEIAHGRCSLPAPATAELLRGVPLAESSVAAELTTPTGAAILAALADAYGPPPAMTIEQIGYGAGQRDLAEQPNLLRVLIGSGEPSGAGERLWMVETNLDDASGEAIGYAIGELWQAGALDVFTAPIQMKKQRPGVTLSVLCRGAEREAVEAVLFRETTTLGLRRYAVDRLALRREPRNVATPWGEVTGVAAWCPDGSVKFAPEFAACQAVAQQHRVPWREVYEAAQRGWRAMVE
jgi:hypothetical protein